MEINRKKLKLTYLLILFLFTLTMFSTTTYAWFTANRVVTINSINVHVAASGGIEISADGTTWKSIITPEDITSVHSSTYTTSTNQIPLALEPVSTAGEIDNTTGFLKVYYGVTDTNNQGEYVLTSIRSVEQEGNGADSTGKFIAFDLFFKVNNDTQVYITKNSQVTYQDESLQKGIANATRVAFVNEGTVSQGAGVTSIQALRNATNNSVYIWEPNYDTHTRSAISNAYSLYGIVTQEVNGNRIIYDGVKSEIGIDSNVMLRNAKSSNFPNYFKTMDVNYYTKNNFTDNVPVFSLSSGITKIRIYMWIEGQDVDCENDASYDDILFDLQFTVNPS